VGGARETATRASNHGVREPTAAQLDQEVGRIAARDRTDTEREASPLRRPDDAVDLDTTELDFDVQVETIVERVRATLRRGAGSG